MCICHQSISTLYLAVLLISAISSLWGHESQNLVQIEATVTSYFVTIAHLEVRLAELPEEMVSYRINTALCIYNFIAF